MLQKIFNVCLFGVLSLSLANASEPYCTRNETIIKRLPVTKTRLVAKKPSGFFKYLKKTKYSTETYEDFEETRQVKPLRVCCDGYRMTELGICEPYCEQGCPKNSVCAEPNICRCAEQYVTAVDASTGSHSCEPICEGTCPKNAYCAMPDVCKCEPGYHEVSYQCVPRCRSGCPYSGKCISTDICECAKGYSAESGTCVPICEIGDGCQHGRCVDTDICVCDSGFVMNWSTDICEECSEEQDCSNVEETTTEFSEETADSEESYSITASYEGKGDEHAEHNCPPNHFFYGNVCRPKQFASNEYDCRFKVCVENAFCQANGTCACNAGYTWFKPQNATVTKVDGETPQPICLTQAEIALRLADIEYRDDNNDDSFDWISLLIISLCVLMLVAVLVALRILWRKRGKLNVEAKNDLSCSYDNKNYSSSPQVY